MGYTPNIAFCPAGIDACGLWRMFMPHLNIPNSRFLFTQGVPLINEMSECDVVVVQRLMMEGNVAFLKILRAHKLKVVYDLDDNVWNLPSFNPASQFFKRDESVKGLETCASFADVITVSTKELQAVVQNQWSYLRNIETGKTIDVVHMDNCADLNLFRTPAVARDDDKIVIGWGGSNTHSGDLQFVWNLLPILLDRYPNVYLEFAGTDAPIKIKDHPRVTKRQWCHISEFHNRFATWNWDIVLAPLDTHRFNRSKSCIKMIEAGCISAPCLAQDIAPYKYFASFTSQLKWLLCSDYDWEKKLNRLIQDKPFRQELGTLMYQNVREHFNITRMVPKWEALMQSLVL